MDLLKLLEDFKKKELEEIKKDRKNGFPIRINQKSYYAKEISYQTVLLKQIIENQKAILNNQKQQGLKKYNDDIEDIAHKASEVCGYILKDFCKEDVLAILKITEILVRATQN